MQSQFTLLGLELTIAVELCLWYILQNFGIISKIFLWFVYIIFCNQTIVLCSVFPFVILQLNVWASLSRIVYVLYVMYMQSFTLAACFSHYSIFCDIQLANGNQSWSNLHLYKGDMEIWSCQRTYIDSGLHREVRGILSSRKNFGNLKKKTVTDSGFLAATSSSIGRAVGQLVGPQNSPLFGSQFFALGCWNLAWRSSVCVCVCVCVCVKVGICVHAHWLKGGAAMGVAYCETVHNFQMD